MSFNGDRLRILRRFHNLTQRDLGALVGSPASTITGYERGTRTPKGIALDALAAALHVVPSFFARLVQDDEFHEAETNFRSLASTPDRLRKQILAHATLFGILIEYLTSSVRLPQIALPKVQANSLHEIEMAAERCRVDWGVGVDAPIKNVTHMIETAGVVVWILDSPVSKQIDAFSRYGATNLIVLNPAKGSATRTRFDIAHEAGHGILHHSGLPTELRLREGQADHFASALLLPRNAFTREFWAFGKIRTWEHFFALKQRWGASLPALVSRVYHLGLIDAADYRRRFVFMSKQGWLRGGEPGEPEPEKAELFSLAFGRFQSETGKSTAGIAQDLNWSPELFRQVTGIDAQPPHDPSIPSLEERRQLKLAAG